MHGLSTDDDHLDHGSKERGRVRVCSGAWKCSSTLLCSSTLPRTATHAHSVFFHTSAQTMLFVRAAHAHNYYCSISCLTLNSLNPTP